MQCGCREDFGSLSCAIMHVDFALIHRKLMVDYFHKGINDAAVWSNVF